MAYQPENPLDPKGRSILTQVAFKEAVRSAIAVGVDVMDASFVERLSFLADALTAEVISQVGNAPAPAAAPQVSYKTPPTVVLSNGAAEQMVVNEFGAEPFGLAVQGTQHGELPPWLIEQAAVKGVSKVWDNRDQVQGTKKPHFRAADGTVDANGREVAFWPPR